MASKTGNPLRRALWLESLDQQLRPHFPAPLPGRCRLANVDGEHLVFLVQSPVWHAKLRLAEPQLIQAARSIGLKVTKVTIKTATSPLYPLPPPPPRPAHTVTAATHRGIRDALACFQEGDKNES